MTGNTAPVMIGPNRTSGWPLVAGPWLPLDNVDPALITFHGTANDVFYVLFGGNTT